MHIYIYIYIYIYYCANTKQTVYVRVDFSLLFELTVLSHDVTNNSIDSHLILAFGSSRIPVDVLENG